MKENSPRAFYKVISLCLKGLIVTASCWYIYTKVFHRPDLPDLEQTLGAAIRQKGWAILLLACLLAPVNWGMEALKWKMLVAGEEVLNFPDSFKSVLSGVTVSALTPNRAGEFAGRIFFLRSGNKGRAALLSITGSACQLFVTLMMGAVGFLFFRLYGLNTLDEPEEKYDLLVRVTAVFALLCFIAAVLLALLLPYLLSNAHLSKRKWIAALDVINRAGRKKIFRVLFLSLLRYLVFAFQFFLLLIFFDAGAGFTDSIILITLTFFAVTVVPTFALTELGVRGAVALLLFEPVTNNAAAVMSASFSLWLINIAMPALAGCFFVFRLHFFRDEQ